MNILRKAEGFENEQLFYIPDVFLSKMENNSLLQYFTISIIGYYPCAKNHYFNRPNGCDTALLMYCSAGSGFYNLNGNPSKTLSAGQIIILPPFVPHEYGASEENPWSIYWVHFKGTFYRPLYEMISPYLPININGGSGSIVGDRIRETFIQCFCILQLPYQKEEYLYLCHMMASMISMIPCLIKNPLIPLTLDGSMGIEKAVAYMKNHLYEEIKGKKLAKASGLSYSRLSYLFKHSTGYAPVDFFLRTKIQAAARDLYFSKLSIKDIALSYGIEDPYYFSRLFKKIMGISPQKFRNKSVD